MPQLPSFRQLPSRLPLAVLACLSLHAGAAQLSDRQASYPPQVQAASAEGENALRRFRVPKGLKVELAAAEPLLANPVAFSIDEQGRFYVAETFRLHAGVTDIRGHMDWLDEELAVKTVEQRVAYMTKHEGKRIADYTKQSDCLRVLWDSDGDGRADQAAVLAEGFNGVADGIAAGVLARQGEVYFANIPSLWKFTVPELRSAKPPPVASFPFNPSLPNRKPNMANLATGFGIRVGFLGHDLHGLCFGPDGRLYFSVGDRGAHVRTREGATIELHETGGVFRCDPDGSNLELFAFGLRNPQELAFDQFGNLWTGDNNSDGGDPARWVYVVEGGDCGWRIGWQFLTSPNPRGAWLAERMCYPQFEGQAAYLLPPLANIGNGPSGLSYFPGTGLNDRFKDRFFLCDFRGGTGSGIHSFGVKPRGAGFEVIDRAEFIWEVLVTDGDFGYDGCFYLTDWVNGWNQTGKGRIYRVFDPETRNSPLVLEVTKLMAAGFDQRPAREQASLMAHPDQRVRQEAQFALATRGASALEPFTEALKSGVDATLASSAAVMTQLQPRLARMHAVWGLGQLARRAQDSATAAKAVSILLPALGDADPEIRAQAAKVLGDARTATAYDALLTLLGDAEPRPRFFAAIALGKLRRKEATPALIALLRANDNKDIYLRHAAVTALAGSRDFPAVRKLVSDESSAVRLAAVLALRRMQDTARLLPGASNQDASFSAGGEIAGFLGDSDPLVVLEAARAINDLYAGGWLALADLLTNVDVLGRQQLASQQQRQRAAAAKNAAIPKPDNEPDVLFAPLLRRVVNANYVVGRAPNAAALLAFAKSGIGPESVRAEAVALLGQWGRAAGADNVTGLWRELESRDARIATDALRPQLESLLKSPSTAVTLAAIKTATKLGLKEGATAAFDVVADAQRTSKVRVEALKALSSFKSSRLNDAVKLALADKDEALRTEATKIQAQIKPSDATSRLRAALDTGSVREKQAAFGALGTMPGSAADTLLLQSLDKLLAGQLAPELQLDLLAAAALRPSRDVKDRLTKFERARPADDEMRSYRECVAGGDAEEGRRIFNERADVFCLRCHKVNGEGGEAGPDLTGIASRKTREYLLESIVYPNKLIAEGFESVELTLKNNTTYAGTLKKETDTEISILSPEDGPVTVKKEELKSRGRGPSAMPEELRQVLSKQDIRNLVEFLGSLK